MREIEPVREPVAPSRELVPVHVAAVHEIVREAAHIALPPPANDLNFPELVEKTDLLAARDPMMSPS